jgi:hypothetical protein
VGRFDLTSGLVVTVTHHFIATARGPIDCISYVTEGLAAHGQRELVFTLRHTPETRAATFAQAMISLIVMFQQFAAQGRTVDAGDITGFGAQRPFPGKHLLYAPARPLDGVPVPQNGLAALFITDSELALVQRCGSSRVLAALGKAYSHYPFPPWSEFQRPELPAAKNLEASVLASVLCAHTWSTRVLQVEGDVILRVAPRNQEHIRQLFEQLPEDRPFALTTGIDGTADACLTWEPGQREPWAITPPGSKAERLSGCFLMVLTGQEQEESRLHEDGFVWLLNSASWKALRHALLEGQALALLAGGKRLRVEWVMP